MKKCFKLVCALLALVLLLTACGEQEPSATKPQEIQQSGPLSLGDQMPELTVTTAQGENLVLSELLQQKKVVVLNFWFVECVWCVREFPVMEVAYQKYKQDVEILALNPYDPQQQIPAFQQEHSLSFPMASCSRDLAVTFGVNSYPTSVVIDREGKICLIHTGAITESQVFDKLFQTFTAEDYTSRVYHSINELL